MGDSMYNSDCRWKIPDDRQLALRGKLDTGWSSYNDSTNYNQHYITEEEHQLINTVLRKQEMIQRQEQYRIGKLVKKLEHMKENILGDGISTCLICGTTSGFLKDQLQICACCGKMVCGKCGVEVVGLADKPNKSGKSGKLYYCVLCNEDQMLWKRSGAWFYNAIPKYEIPESNNNLTGDLNDSSPGSAPSNSSRTRRKSSSSVDFHVSVDSFDNSDDSDLENTSASAFQIPEDKLIAGCYINTDEDSRSLRSVASSGGQRVSNASNHSVSNYSSSNYSTPSITVTTLEEAERNYQNKYSRQSSLRSTSKESDHVSETSSLNSSTGSHHEGVLGASASTTTSTTLGMFQKMNRDETLEVSDSASHEFIEAPHQDNESRSLSNGSAVSDQDIDAMFESYESDKPEEKEYNGKYGMVKFTVQYDTNTQELLIIIDSCRGLKFGERDTLPNPYVQTVILPVSPDAAKAYEKRTPSMKRNADPVFNFSIVYPGIAATDIENKGVRLSVMEDSNLFGGNHPTIGETCIPLKGLSTRPVQQFRRILDLRANDSCLFLDTKKGETNPGRIELALHYLSKQEQLVVGVIRCVGLKALDPNGYSDPYVKCYLLPDPQKKTKRKTVVKKKTLNPEFNQEFQYNISHGELAKKTLYISVWDHDVGRTNDFIGSLTLGIASTGEILRHWFDTLKTADRRVIRWHNLSEDFTPVE